MTEFAVEIEEELSIKDLNNHITLKNEKTSMDVREYRIIKGVFKLIFSQNTSKWGDTIKGNFCFPWENASEFVMGKTDENGYVIIDQFVATRHGKYYYIRDPNIKMFYYFKKIDFMFSVVQNEETIYSESFKIDLNKSNVLDSDKYRQKYDVDEKSEKSEIPIDHELLMAKTTINKIRSDNKKYVDALSHVLTILRLSGCKLNSPEELKRKIIGFDTLAATDNTNIAELSVDFFKNLIEDN